MNSTQLIVVAGIGLLFVPVLATTEGRDARSRNLELDVELEVIKEVRRQVISTTDDESSLFDQPGLELRFGCRLPAGRTLVSVEQPTSVQAMDSTGRDLATIEPNVFGQREYVSTVWTWGEAPEAFTLTLMVPARAAESFSLAARMDAVTYADLRTQMLEPSETWATVPDDPFDGTGVKMRVKKSGAATEVQFEPGTIKDLIESIELVDGEDAETSQSSMWNDQRLTYGFDRQPGKGTLIRLQVRRELARTPIVVELTEQTLP